MFRKDLKSQICDQLLREGMPLDFFFCENSPHLRIKTKNSNSFSIPFDCRNYELQIENKTRI